MAINYGWFANLSSIATLNNSISGSSLSGTGAGFEITAKRGPFGSTRFLGNGPSAYLTIDFDGSNVDVKKSTSDITTLFTFGLDDGEPHSVKVVKGANPSGGAPAFQFFIDDNDRGWVDGGEGNNDLWTINALLSAASAGKEGSISQAIIRSDASTIIANWDGNFVLNAAGDAFITRTEANNNPSLAESGYDLKMYDTTSVSGNHIDLPSGTTWDFAGSSVLPDTLTAGETGVPFTAPVGFNVTSILLGTTPLTFTFDSGTGQGTIDAPAMGTVAGLPRFGPGAQLQLIDSGNGNTAENTVEWLAPAPYVVLTLDGDPDTSSMTNAYYNWQDPPVAGDQAVYEPTYYSINQGEEINGDPTSAYYGRLVIDPDAPPTFSVNEYVVDDDGVQEFTRTSEASVTIGDAPEITLNGPALINHTQGTPYTDQGADWTDTEDGSGTVFSNTVVDERSPAGNYEQVYVYTDTDGNSASVTRVVVVSVVSTLTVNVSDTPDGTYETYVIDVDNTEIIFDGDKDWAGESASFTFEGIPAGTNCVVVSLGVDDGGLVKGATV